MGAVGSTFGRNMAPDYRPDLFDEPSPVEVSRQLLYRDHFIPARSLNILAAAWIQFQVHDWVNHARHPLGVDDVSVAAAAGCDLDEHPRRRPRGPDADRREHPAPRRDQRRRPGVRQQDVALVGRLRGLRRRPGAQPRAAGRREAAAERRRLPARRHQRAGDDRLQRELVDGAEQPAHAVRPRAQRALRRAPGALPRLERRQGLPDRAADRVRADSQDPHRRVDPRDPGDRGDRRRPEEQLERSARPATG